MTNPRQCILDRAAARGLNLSELSRMIGRSYKYLDRFVNYDVPKRLPEDDRRLLAICLDVDERELGARDPWAPAVRI